MAETRVFYTMLTKADGKKKELEKFLKKEWIPALLSAKGCLRVELLDDYYDRPGYCIWEYWESEAAHRQQSPELWNAEKPDVWQKMLQLAIIENLRECRVVETQDQPR